MAFGKYYFLGKVTFGNTLFWGKNDLREYFPLVKKVFGKNGLGNLPTNVKKVFTAMTSPSLKIHRKQVYFAPKMFHGYHKKIWISKILGLLRFFVNHLLKICILNPQNIAWISFFWS